MENSENTAKLVRLGSLAMKYLTEWVCHNQHSADRIWFGGTVRITVPRSKNLSAMTMNLEVYLLRVF